AKQYNGEFKISVNITAKSLLWDIDDCIQEFEEKYEVSPKKLWIEITEQDMISKADVIINKINKLKSMGHTLIIDDFGMGYTSLLYLQSNFFNIVKLDGSLIRDILTNTTNQKIVASIVELGEKLNVKVIAEYVETKEQCQLLEELGCNLYQGYFFSKPISLEDFIKELKRRNEPFVVSNTQN
ncbi:MAG: EAL domain-containing protein, partial [Lachnospiraceae bacterium]|nr:EAL domain-containing protein [Lachnospiraceae bacterium]